MSDPFENTALWLELFGEETVNEMTENTGDATNVVREIFPRVTFRDVADAEMVVEMLRVSLITMSGKAANTVKVWNLKQAANFAGSVGLPIEVLVIDGNGKEADAKETLKDIVVHMTRALEFFDSVIAQIAQLYGTPDEENAKYVSGLLDFSNEVRDYIGTAQLVTDEMHAKSGEK